MSAHVTVLCTTPQGTVEMDSKSILVSVVIGILVGGIVGYQLVPTPDYSPYEDQIAQLHSQVSSLSTELDARAMSALSADLLMHGKDVCENY
jgi:hypothetical protein